MKKILLIRFKQLGDVALLFPVIEAIKAEYPTWQVDVLTSNIYKEVFSNSPLVNNIWGLDDSLSYASSKIAHEILKESYDIIADLHSSYQGSVSSEVLELSNAKERYGFYLEGYRNLLTYSAPPRTYDHHYVESYFSVLKPLDINFRGLGQMTLTRNEIAKGKKLLDECGASDRPICLIPGARLPYKVWPAENFAILAQRLSEKGYSPVIVGHSADYEYLHEVWKKYQSAGLIQLDSLRELSSVFLNSRAVVCNDSGLKHLAVAAGAKIVALHGHSDPLVWGPWGDFHHIVTKDIDCRPCNHLDFCPLGSSICLTLITPDEVVDAVEQLVG